MYDNLLVVTDSCNDMSSFSHSPAQPKRPRMVKNRRRPRFGPAKASCLEVIQDCS